MSTEGRLGRLGFARGMLLAMIYADACFILACALGMVGGWLGAPLLLLAPLCLVFQISLTIRRLHDRNKRAYWVVVFLAVPLVAQLMAVHLIQDHRLLGGVGSMLTGAGLGLAGFGLSCWYWIEMLFIPGVSGDNRYGPDGLMRRSAAA